MATDRDRYARKLDKRFGTDVYFALVSGAADAVTLLSEHVERREREPGDDLAELFRFANRVALNRALALLPNHMPEIARIEARGREGSMPAMRIALAFQDAQAYGIDLAVALATRQANWIGACLNGQPDWPEARDPFEKIKPALIDELARRIRRRYLGVGEPLVRGSKKTKDQSAILAESFKVNP